VGRLFTALWRGDVPLWKTFWEYAVVYGFFVNAVATIGSLMLFSADEPLWGMIVHFLPTPYNVLMLVAVWRAAGKYAGRAEWATAARIAAVIVFPIAIAA
jgi:hypothetical protein